MPRSRAISPQKPKSANLAHTGADAYETAANRRVNKMLGSNNTWSGDFLPRKKMPKRIWLTWPNFHVLYTVGASGLSWGATVVVYVATKRLRKLWTFCLVLFASVVLTYLKYENFQLFNCKVGEFSWIFSNFWVSNKFQDFLRSFVNFQKISGTFGININYMHFTIFLEFLGL